MKHVSMGNATIYFKEDRGNNTYRPAKSTQHAELPLIFFKRGFGSGSIEVIGF
jgi:hypothetical protein